MLNIGSEGVAKKIVRSLENHKNISKYFILVAIKIKCNIAEGGPIYYK